MNYLSEDRNSVEYAIVQGDQDKLHPVPAEMVRVNQSQNELMAEIDKQTFQESPSFNQDEKPQLEQQQWSQDIRGYYPQQQGGQKQQ